MTTKIEATNEEIQAHIRTFLLGNIVSAVMKHVKGISAEWNLIHEEIQSEIISNITMDIKEELAKPGRDPREPFQIFEFSEEIETMNDLKPGMKLNGVVTNVTAFGCFVDIGVHQDGLIHISQLSDRYVKDPNDIVKVHQRIKVTVLEVDLDRKRIALTAKNNS